MKQAMDDDSCDLTKVDTKVYAKNPKLTIFQNLKGVKYDEVESGFGSVLCIPHVDIAEFEEFAKGFDGENVFIANQA